MSSNEIISEVRYKEFSYGKQSLEVDCFYSGPFLFLEFFSGPQAVRVCLEAKLLRFARPSLCSALPTSLKTENPRQSRGLSFLYVTRAVCYKGQGIVICVDICFRKTSWTVGSCSPETSSSVQASANYPPAQRPGSSISSRSHARLSSSPSFQQTM